MSDSCAAGPRHEQKVEQREQDATVNKRREHTP